MKRAISILVVLLLVAFAVKFGLTFPWKEMFITTLHAQLGFVLIASVANVLSQSAKGEGWTVLMGAHGTQHRRTAHVATLVGGAAGAIAVSIGGDAVRTRWLIKRSDITTTTAVRALVASRFAEAIALALLILLGGVVLPQSNWVRISSIAAAALLVIALLLWWYGRSRKHSPWPAGRVKRALAEGRMVLHQPGIALAIVWSFVNWLLQWFSFWIGIVAVAGHCPIGYPLAILILCNVGGALKLTPANVGVLTASMLMVAKPFRITAPAAFAASIVLQAVQTLPMLLVGGALVVADRRRTPAATAL